MDRLSTTCLISNCNYAHFLGDAIEGALRQTVPFDEIIVVDDGSTDGSIEMLQTRFGRHPLVHIVPKDREGQLSCFNHGVAHATGDIVFFLDADDIYEPPYVEQALHVFDQHPTCDFLFCGRRLFGLQDSAILEFANDVDFGHSLLRTMYQREWIGASTSCLSIRRQILDKILPLPFVDEWRVRADDCLVFGASLANARKRYLAKLLVRYRVHNTNYYRGRTADQATTYRRRLAINQLFEHLERKFCYNAERFAEFHHREFCTIESPSLGQLIDYARIGLHAKISPFRRLMCMMDMLRHFLRTKTRRDSISQDSESHLADNIISFERFAQQQQQQLRDAA